MELEVQEGIIFKTSDEVIEFFKGRHKDDPTFVELLEESLHKAKASAEMSLDKDLFQALEWPLNVVEYIDYLYHFARWAPKESTEPAWQDPDGNGSQEVYDRLCHFYFLIDQEVGPNNVVVQSIPWFSQFLVWYADVWGSFLNTTESFNDEILDSFINDSPKYRVQDSMINGKPNNPSGWLTFNQFFARELNSGLRPIANPMNNQVVTMPADCTYRAKYAIDANSKIPEITVKQTHKFADINQLLKGSKYSDSFANGTFVHYFLGPYSYHRFHTPVAGKVEESFAIRGQVFLDVDITEGQFDAPDNSEGAYEFYQSRGVITIDTTNSPYGDMGIVAVIPIGMAQVSSVNMIATPGKELLKGDEFGYFLFGGSDIIMLFQEGKAPKINENGDVYRLYGSDVSKA